MTPSQNNRSTSALRRLGYQPSVACRKLRLADPELGWLMDQVGPFKLAVEFEFSPFQVLVRAIVYQQLSGTSAAAIYGRLQQLFVNPSSMTPAELSDISDEQLRQAGLSSAKILAVRDLADKALANAVPGESELRNMSDEQIVDQLTQIRGIGRWTVEMMLIHRLGRPDVLPVGDFGIRKGYQLLRDLENPPRPSDLAKTGQAWAPYRSVAAWYLWRATDSVDWATADRPAF